MRIAELEEFLLIRNPQSSRRLLEVELQRKLNLTIGAESDRAAYR